MQTFRHRENMFLTVHAIRVRALWGRTRVEPRGLRMRWNLTRLSPAGAKLPPPSSGGSAKRDVDPRLFPAVQDEPLLLHAWGPHTSPTLAEPTRPPPLCTPFRTYPTRYHRRTLGQPCITFYYPQHRS